MEKLMSIQEKNICKHSEGVHNKNAAALYRRLILLLLLVSLASLILAGIGIHGCYSKFTTSIIHDIFYTKTDDHRKTIEQFFKNQITSLHLIAHSHPKGFFQEKANLSKLFEDINQQCQSITDLGIIDAQGNQMAYFGPYDLMGKNYSNTVWFKQVMKKDRYISDMFPGYRNEPHFIMAVTMLEKGEKWILRATVDTETFRSLVENVNIGKTGEVYLLNRRGVYQTEPRLFGKILEKASVSIDSLHKGINIKNIEDCEKKGVDKKTGRIISFTKLDNPNWVLVLSQDRAEAYQKFDQADRFMLICLILTAFVMIISGFVITKCFLKFLEKPNFEAEITRQHSM